MSGYTDTAMAFAYKDDPSASTSLTISSPRIEAIKAQRQSKLENLQQKIQTFQDQSSSDNISSSATPPIISSYQNASSTPSSSSSSPKHQSSATTFTSAERAAAHQEARFVHRHDDDENNNDNGDSSWVDAAVNGFVYCVSEACKLLGASSEILTAPAGVARQGYQTLQSFAEERMMPTPAAREQPHGSYDTVGYPQTYHSSGGAGIQSGAAVGNGYNLRV